MISTVTSSAPIVEITLNQPMVDAMMITIYLKL